MLSRDGVVGLGPIAIHSLSDPSSTAATTAGAKVEPLSVDLLTLTVP